LTFHILEMLGLIPSSPFEGYKLGHIQTMERRRIQLLREKILWINFTLH